VPLKGGAAVQTALHLQEAFPGALNLSGTEFDIIINDRGIAPNTAETPRRLDEGDETSSANAWEAKSLPANRLDHVSEPSQA
jgi:hypothetical protein